MLRASFDRTYWPGLFGAVACHFGGFVARNRWRIDCWQCFVGQPASIEHFYRIVERACFTFAHTTRARSACLFACAKCQR